MTAPDENLRKQLLAILHAPTTGSAMFHRTFQNATRAQFDPLCTEIWDPYPRRKIPTLAAAWQPPALRGF
jgi:hypothetical protein